MTLVKYLLQEINENKNDPVLYGLLIKQNLEGAVRGGHLEILKYLLSQGPDSLKDYIFPTAVKYKHLDIIKYLIDQGVNTLDLAVYLKPLLG